MTAWQLGRHLGRGSIGVGTATPQAAVRLCSCRAVPPLQCCSSASAPSQCIGGEALPLCLQAPHSHTSHTHDPAHALQMQQEQERQRRRSERLSRLAAPQAGPWLWRLLRRSWARAGHLAADHTRSTLILAVFAFKVRRHGGAQVHVDGGVWGCLALACSLLCYVPLALLLCACVLLACMSCVGLVRRTTLGAPSAHLTHAPPPLWSTER